jgi:hypothetical protein
VRLSDGIEGRRRRAPTAGVLAVSQDEKHGGPAIGPRQSGSRRQRVVQHGRAVRHHAVQDRLQNAARDDRPLENPHAVAERQQRQSVCVRELPRHDLHGRSHLSECLAINAVTHVEADDHVRAVGRADSVDLLCHTVCRVR